MAKPRIQLEAILEAAADSKSFSETAERLGTTVERIGNELRAQGVRPKDFKATMWARGSKPKAQIRDGMVKPEKTESEALVPIQNTENDLDAEDDLDPDEDLLQDPIKILELLKEAILRRGVDLPLLTKAIKQVLENYEFQNRLFLVAAANAELPRILRLVEFVNSCESELFKQTRVQGASNRELAKMYALAQTNLISGLDRVKQVADMRLEMIRATGSGSGDMSDLFKPSKTLEDLAGVPALNAQGRDRVRKLLTGVLNVIDSEDSTYDGEE